MKDKQKTAEIDQWDTWAQATYRTGSTKPPKRHGGLVAFLLVMVIFLCGISTALGLMNIRLLDRLNQQQAPETAPIAFSQGEAMEIPADAVKYPLGFAGQAVPDFWQNYNRMPAGIYVVEVSRDSHSRSQDLLPGDILTHLENTALTTQKSLEDALSAYLPGDTVQVVLIRDGQELTVSLVVEEEAE